MDCFDLLVSYLINISAVSLHSRFYYTKCIMVAIIIEHCSFFM